MTKATLRIHPHRKLCIGSHKNVHRIPKEVIHVHVGFNNAIITIADVRGQVVSWAFAGTSGFKGPRRGTPYASQVVAVRAIRIVVRQGMRQTEVMIKGASLRRDAVLQAISERGIRLSLIHDVTPMPHNGCRPPKKRRV